MPIEKGVRSFAVVLFAWLACACGSGGREQCVTGQSIACTCLGGSSGGQVCLADGTYGECDCTAPLDGATPDSPLAVDSSRAGDGGTDAATGGDGAGDALGSDAILGECNWAVAVPDVPPSGEITGSFDAPRTSELSSPDCLGFGGEQAFRYTVSAANRGLRVSTDFPETTVDTVVYVRANCRDSTTEVACDDGSGALTGEADLSTPVLPIGSYFIIVDSYSYGSLGAFKLQVTELKGAGEACTPAAADCVAGLACHAVSSGSSPICTLPSCDDGLDNDGDLKVDFPNEPGCTDERDDDEADPSPTPQCGNGLDDDGDLLIDYPADPSCSAASDVGETNECIAGVPVTTIVAGTTTGTTVGGTTLLSPPAGCGSSSAGTPERVFEYRNTRTLSRLRVSSLGSAFDAMLYARRDDCSIGGPRSYCDTDSGGGDVAVLDLPNPSVGAYYVVVDGEGAASGSFSITISGEVAAGQPCDVGDANFTCTAGFQCDGGTCVPGACNDGTDNDGDGKADAADPGCDAVSDLDEADPAVLPACSNGIDDDGDLLSDYPADVGCLRASDTNEDDCADRDPIIDVTHSGGTYDGTTRTKTNDFHATCSAGSGAAPDVVHVFKVPGRVTITADTCGTGFDTTLTVQRDCTDDPPLACDDDASITGCSSQSRVVDVALEAGVYYLIVDGYSTSSGLYTLNLTGTVGDGELCDPLQIVPGFLSCGAGRTCRDLGTGMRCQ